MIRFVMDACLLQLRPKDFIETHEGLIFAVVSSEPESGRIPAYLRYRRTDQGLLKIPTAQAASFLAGEGRHFFYDSESRAIRMQGVPVDDVQKVFSSRKRASEILNEKSLDRVVVAAQKLIRYLVIHLDYPEQLGVTGSLLIGAQNAKSDIDLVVFDRWAFGRLRDAILEGIGSGALEDLKPEDWREAHERRGCALSFEDYLDHERRKGNKALVDGIKFDLTLSDADQNPPEPAVAKESSLEIVLKVTDAEEAYGFPARYRTEHPEIIEILAFSQTYAGQALAGETVRVRGRTERLVNGRRRIVVGMDREARDEFIKLEPKATP